MENMYKDTFVGLIPKAWKLIKLNKLTSKITDGTHKTPKYTESGIPFLRVTDIKTGLVDWNNTKFVSLEEHEEMCKRCKPQYGDILYSKNGTIGVPKVVDWEKEFSIFVSLCLIKPIHEFVDNKFLEQYLASSSCKRQIDRRSKQGTVTNLHLEEIRELDIPVPPLPEQKKIAKILSTVDEYIDEVDGMIQDLKELKKGLMQKLLTQGIGHTEFKDSPVGRIPVEWEVKDLLAVSTNKPVYGINASAKNYVEGEPRYLRISDIGEDGRLVKIDVKSVDSEDYSEYMLEKNDIVFARTGNTTGKTFLYEGKYGKLVFAGFLIKFNIDEKIADSDFIALCCNTKRYWDWVSVMSQRSGQPGINSKEYSTFKLPIPCIEEQRRISKIIRAIDNRINIYIDKKEELKELKKGLMQQLLTGKVRVKIDN